MEIVKLHEVPLTNLSDRDNRFVSNFEKSLPSFLGTKLLFSTAFHPQTDGQNERVNKILENMFRAYVLEFGGN